MEAELAAVRAKYSAAVSSEGPASASVKKAKKAKPISPAIVDSDEDVDMSPAGTTTAPVGKRGGKSKKGGRPLKSKSAAVSEVEDDAAMSSEIDSEPDEEILRKAALAVGAATHVGAMLEVAQLALIFSPDVALNKEQLRIYSGIAASALLDGRDASGMSLAASRVWNDSIWLHERT